MFSGIGADHLDFEDRHPRRSRDAAPNAPLGLAVVDRVNYHNLRQLEVFRSQRIGDAVDDRPGVACDPRARAQSVLDRIGVQVYRMALLGEDTRQRRLARPGQSCEYDQHGCSTRKIGWLMAAKTMRY